MRFYCGVCRSKPGRYCGLRTREGRRITCVRACVRARVRTKMVYRSTHCVNRSPGFRYGCRGMYPSAMATAASADPRAAAAVLVVLPRPAHPIRLGAPPRRPRALSTPLTMFALSANPPYLLLVQLAPPPRTALWTPAHAPPLDSRELEDTDIITTSPFSLAPLCLSPSLSATSTYKYIFFLLCFLKEFFEIKVFCWVRHLSKWSLSENVSRTYVCTCSSIPLFQSNSLTISSGIRV